MSRKWILVPVAAVVAIFVVIVGISLYYNHGSPASQYYGPTYFGWGFGWPFFGFGWILIPLFFIFIFFGLRWIFWGGWGWGRQWGISRSYYDPAIQTLRERLARGEITKEQFDDIERKLVEDFRRE